ncbi:sodium/hydrogen exchanger 9-like isoform X3 [Pomacea canaliculata]|uniref:sodium/hydrogen exchanger 9-like isoform X3 n=1 Tax=Pomacea canaliculata TaxID=400727 RepID=UPI000D72A1E4|nr:sodium/hydrogen exchanger 9-like isoform X3 [Pomacea canaliculata]
MASRTFVCLTAALLCIKTSTMGLPEDEIKPSIDTKAASKHSIDSLTILMLLGLLLLTILTVWFFKYRRFRFVHETGLSMLYGLIVGVIIRYTSSPNATQGYATAVVTDNTTYYSDSPPDIVYINFSVRNTTNQLRIKYDLAGTVNIPVTEPPLERTVTFDPEIFFNVMLPVIIFEAGYSMKRRHFFRNLGAIMTYALIGTTISCLVVGGILYGMTSLMYDISFNLTESIYFGAIISATDPVTVLAIFHDLHVDVDLYALVFGESVLNDAVAIVLSESVSVYGALAANDSFNAQSLFQSVGRFVGVFTGSFAIGGLFGVSTAFLTKFTKVKEFPLLETALFFLMSYCSFQAAEAAAMTGIVAVLFCGITQAHYTYNNLSVESKIRTKQLFELGNFLAENFVFLYIGVSVFTLQPLRWHAGFILSSFLAVIIGRMMNVYPLTFLLNLGRSNKIRPNFQHMMMFAGLRGAVAFALAIRNIQTVANQHMAAATMMIVLATVILCGGFTTPMLQWLQIRVGVEDDATVHLNQLSTSHNAAHRQYNSMEVSGSGRPTAHSFSQQMTASGIQMSGSRSEKAWLVGKWYNFDMRFMKPLLTHARPSLMDTMPKCCLPLARLLTTEEQLSQGICNENDSDVDMIIDPNHLSLDGVSDNRVPADQMTVVDDTVRKEAMQVVHDESQRGDLGLGQTNEPLVWRIGIYGPPGDKV